MYGTNTTLNFNATHSYIRFTPASQEDLDILENWERSSDYVIVDHPLDYELIEYGDYYIDPNVSDSLLTYRYTVVPTGTILPNVSNTNLSDVYLDDNNPLLLAQSFKNIGLSNLINSYVIGGNYIPQDEIEEFHPSITSSVPEPPLCPPGCLAVLTVDFSQTIVAFQWVCECDETYVPQPINDCGCNPPLDKNIPAGCIEVQNIGTTYDGVSIAQVKLWYGFFNLKKTFTDENGCWEASKRAKGPLKVQVFFDNDNVEIRGTNYWFGTKVLRDKGYFRSQAPYNDFEIKYNKIPQLREWAAAHSINADFEYSQMATTIQIPLPRSGLNVLLDDSDGIASAPMLQGNTSYPQALAFLQVSLPIIGFLQFLTAGLKPDVTNTYDLLESALDFKRIHFHEYAHASHFSIVGNGYWNGFRDHIVVNDGYGTYPNFVPIFSHPGKVALGESLARYIEFKFSSTTSSGGTSGGGTYGGEDNAFQAGYLPHGLHFDLEDVGSDNISDPTSSLIVTDNISGFTPSMIFSSLSPGIIDIRTFRDRLNQNFLSSTGNNVIDYNNLFDVYDVFN